MKERTLQPIPQGEKRIIREYYEQLQMNKLDNQKKKKNQPNKQKNQKDEILETQSAKTE